MMTVLHLIDDGAQLAAQLLREPHAKEFRDAVGRQPPESDLAAALEKLMDREVALEDEVAAVLDLGDGVEAREVHLVALPLGELGSQDQRPVVELLLNDRGARAGRRQLAAPRRRRRPERRYRSCGKRPGLS